jgi:hypothetical protein
MKTTHQIARELLALPDVELVIEGWCPMDNHEMVAEITSYDENTVIIWQKPDPRLPARTEFHAPSGSWRWLNISTQLPESPTP